ncbi:MAG: hypothetical protein VX189_04780, partial [Planctomycetota bacterium]|nr:hypothetical protein [Planctomycetota bacterium]
MTSPFKSNSNDLQAQWFDAIVRQVVERLTDLGGKPEPAMASGRDEASAVTSADEIHLGDAVITMESLRGLKIADKKIVVSAKAVVTPAVKDELRERNATLDRRLKLESPSENVAAELSCIAQGTLNRVEPQLMGLGLKIIDANSVGWDALRQSVASAVETAGGAILVALEPYVAACELNRTDCLRAGYAATSTAMSKLAQQLKPNVMVIDARRYTHATLREALDQLKRIHALSP